MEDGKYVVGSIYFYAPNKIAPAIFGFLFFVSMALHVWQCIHYKCWRAASYFPWAALLFAAGYVVREVGTFNIGNIQIYVASVFLIYIAPPVYEFGNYILLSRALYYIPHCSPIHPGRVLSTYGAISVIVEILNSIGAIYSANTKLTQRTQDVGKAFVKISLVLQLFVQLSFVLLALSFHMRCKKAGTFPKKLKTILLTLYGSSGLIGIRTMYRTVEYFSVANIHYSPNLDPNTFSPIIRYEWFFWVFEATVMVTNSLLINARHPMKYLPRSKTIYLSEDGITEIQGTGYDDKRTTWQTFLDPFNLAGRKEGKKNHPVREGERISGIEHANTPMEEV